MKAHTAEEVLYYQEKLALNSRLADWQFQQAVRAIRNLFVLTQSDVQHEIDWETWISDSATLKPEHSSLAREHGSLNAKSMNIQHFKESDTIDTESIRDKYKSVLDNLLIEIRRRAYSICTEHAYFDWVVRFFAFFCLFSTNTFIQFLSCTYFTIP